MIIENLFAKPVRREINGVIKADQMDAESIWQELDEYVVTRELDEHFRHFLDAYLAGGRDRGDAPDASKNGVWISGFFGSGKSHFLKILSYILENTTVTVGGRTRQAIDFFDGKIQDPMLAADMQRAVGINTQTILFNVDSKADSQDERVILGVFLRVLNEKLGYCADHTHIAHLERYLASKGKLQVFHDAFENETGSKWVDERDAYQFHIDATMTALSAAVNLSSGDADRWFEKFQADFKPTIENFAKWVAEYLDASGIDRLVFLADEIGAFIGTDSKLMLNLQTIVENLGTVCGGRAWVLVTSQADMDTILGELRSTAANDFSKIQGRFKTRLSLSGAHANEVIQKRLLAKTTEATADLKTLFGTKADILRNQVSFRETGMTFKAYAGDEDFAAVYPFVPYQFQLVQKVFDASRLHGATGAHLAKGERSMLDAFRTAVLTVADDETGRLVPFHYFYPAIESFLEDIVRRAIKGVESNESLEAFDADLLKTLFLIRYIDEIKGNVDNLVTLFIDKIDADRLAIKRKIEDSLQRLEGQTLVNRNGENYYFLTNEERDISREISKIENTGAEETKLLNSIVFEEVLRNLTRGKFRHKATGNDFDINRLTDGAPFSSRIDGSLTFNVITPLSDEYGDYGDAAATLKSTDNDGQVILVLGNEKDLAREVKRYLQTEKLALRKLDGSQPQSVTVIIRDQQTENSERRERIKIVLDRLVRESKIYIAGQHVENSGGSAQAIADDALDYLVDNTFKKLDLLTHRSEDPRREIPAALRETLDEGLDLKGGDHNSGAITEVREYIKLMQASSKQVVLFELAAGRFARRPFGWNEWETVLLVARLISLGELSLAVDGHTLQREKIWDAIDGPNKWRRVTVHVRKTVDRDVLQKVRELGRTMFSKVGPDNEDGLAKELRELLAEWSVNLKGWLQLADTGSYPGKSEIADANGVIRKALAIEDASEFLSHLYDNKADLLDIADDYADVQGFYTNQKKPWDDMRSALDRFKANDAELRKDDAATVALDRIAAILAMPEPYGSIREGAALTSKIDEVNTTLVTSRRDHAFQQVDERISLVQAELNRHHLSGDFSNRALRPLQNIRKQIAAQESIAHIYQLQNQAKEAYDEAFDLVELEGAQIRKPPAPTPPTPGMSEPAGPAPRLVDTRIAPMVKKRSILRTADLLKAGEFIETAAEAEKFLKALEDRLLAALKNNERVEIR
ncbi:MAG: hypothetical protein JWR51_4590 [Devosia sp.]|uniref:BREX system P-loop protein BrxC n=1 Tax=Devosia sp. TaxID=1871048 RepID=UPI002602E487|nr:BREX system P-loop protein BrxC [Devosia sp.]MDB5531487.1 hypothetical protein [Devosia sp.]